MLYAIKCETVCKSTKSISVLANYEYFCTLNKVGLFFEYATSFGKTSKLQPADNEDKQR